MQNCLVLWRCFDVLSRVEFQSVIISREDELCRMRDELPEI
uniref:Uncharacterized protein n=1 Tax=Rhizophora mucronata TaxID=61149 RepID=A0A2P2PQE9_RHIMU